MSGSANTPKLGLRQKLRQSLSSKKSNVQATSPSSGSTTTANVIPSNVVLLPNAGTQVPLHATPLPPQQRRLKSSPSLSQPLAVQAIQRLPSKERATLQEFTSSSVVNISDAVEQAIHAAVDKRKICLDKRWTCTIAGRNVVLRETADKALHWLNRFKAVGDVASNADPVHVGLPWAGIRFLLEVAVAESNQMAALLIGCEAALYMASRLEVYVDFIKRLPMNLPRNNLEESIVLLYAHILLFLARAIQIYQESAIGRMLSAILKIDEIVNFEKEGDQLAAKIERDASGCSRLASAQDSQTLSQLQQTLERTLIELQQVRQLQASIDRLHLKIDLSSIPYTKRAIFNSVDSTHDVCHPATRLDLLDQVQSWAQQPDGKHIFWLHGAAGAGKSTISRTFAQWLNDSSGISNADLGASFFFKRGEGDQGSAVRFFPTIVRQLVVKIPGLDVLIAKVMEQDPFIFDKALAEQFRQLLLQPLQDPNLQGLDLSLIIVIDALDECENDAHIENILQLWQQLIQTTHVRIRLFLTSRSERPLRLQFQSLSDDLFNEVVLQDAVPQSTMEHDLSIYLRDTFSAIRKRYSTCFPTEQGLSTDWPGSDVLQRLVNISVPLFIVAATICRFVGDLEFDPAERLEEVLALQNTGQMEQIEMTYLPVLRHLTTSTRSAIEQKKLLEEFRTVIGAVICAAESFCVVDLAVLLNRSTASIQRRLGPLHSVLRIPQDCELPVQTLHSSFAEFLLSERSQNRPFGISGPATHLALLGQCLGLLSGPDGLQENICQLDFPGHLRRDVIATVLAEKFPPVLRYACRYWVHHCQNSSTMIEDDDIVHKFLQRHFLHWIEALSFMNRVSEAVGILGILQKLLSATNSIRISLFVEHARRFILANRSIIDLAPLQLYSSSLAFGPQSSAIRHQWGSGPAWIQRGPKTPCAWGSELQTLEGHAGSIYALAFSHDNSLIASASVDRTIRLWQVNTGQEVQKLEGHTLSVSAVMFSADSKILASASSDTTVRLWQVGTGYVLHKLEGHTDCVRAIAFLPDSTLIASASVDSTVRLWQISTGQEVKRIAFSHGSHGWMAVSAFSPDCSLLAHTTGDWNDFLVRLWQISPDDKILKCEGHPYDIHSVVFSPSGKQIASASGDSTVRLWDAHTGEIVQKFEGHTDQVNAVAFSSDGILLASVSYDREVRLWQVSTGQVLRNLKGHAGIVNVVAFSPDCSLLASASHDTTIRLLQVDVAQPEEVADGHSDAVTAVTFSPDGTLFASASRDSQVRLWLVSSGRAIRSFPGHTGWITSIKFSPDGSFLASASSDNTVRLWRVSTGEELHKFEGCKNSYFTKVSFSPDGRLLAFASSDGSIYLLEVSTGQEVRRFDVRSRYATALAFSSDSSLLAIGSTDREDRTKGVVSVWQVSTGQEVPQLHGEVAGTVAIAYSSAGALLALASNDHTDELWQVHGVQQIQNLETMVNISKLNCRLDEVSTIINQEKPSYHMTGTSILPSGQLIHSDYSLANKWILYRGQKLLWLPHEYRSRVCAIYGNTIGIGRSDGRVTFLTLSYP